MRLDTLMLQDTGTRDARGRPIETAVPHGTPRELSGNDVDVCRVQAKELLLGEGLFVQNLSCALDEPSGETVLRACVRPARVPVAQVPGWVYRGDATALRARGSMRRPIEQRLTNQGDPLLLSPAEKARLARGVAEDAPPVLREMARHLRGQRSAERAAGAARRVGG